MGILALEGVPGPGCWQDPGEHSPGSDLESLSPFREASLGPVLIPLCRVW